MLPNSWDQDNLPQGSDSNYHWNSQIGRYTVLKQGNDLIYQTKKGNFKRIPTQLGYKFVRV